MVTSFFFLMRAYFIKFLLSAVDLSGRWFLRTQKLPSIGEIKKNLAYGGHKNQSVDLLLPASNTNQPGIIYVHGGGWLVGHKDSYHNLCVQWAALGHPVVNVNYRLGPRFHYREQVADINQAIRYAHKLFQEHGFVSDQLILIGDSAGAHLVSWYATAAHKPQLAAWAGLENLISPESIRALVLIYGAYNLETTYHSGFKFIKTFYTSLLGTQPSPQEIVNLSPLHQIQKTFPPAFIFALESDKLYAESLALIQKLESLNLSYEKLLVPKGQYAVDWHGLINFEIPFAQDAMQAIQNYLNRIRT